MLEHLPHSGSRQRASSGHRPVTHDHLVATAIAEELKQTYQRLQEERSQLLLQQHLLSRLTDLLGHYRAVLRDGDAELLSDICTTGLEESLLAQLTIRTPLAAASPATSSTDSRADSNSSIMSEPVADTAYDTASSGEQEDDTGTSPAVYRSAGAGQHHTSAGAPADMASSWGPSALTASAVTASLQETSTADSTDSSSKREKQQQELWRQQLFEPASPSDNPFYLLYRIYDQKFDERANHITLDEALAQWAADVTELRSHFQRVQMAMLYGTAQLEHRAPVKQQPQQQQQQQQQLDPVEGIKQVQMRMFVLLNSLLAADKFDLYFEMQLTNWITGERIPEPDKGRHLAALQKLQLTPEQQRRIAAGWKFFQNLLAPVVRERKQLHAQGVHAPPRGYAAAAAPVGPQVAPNSHSSSITPVQSEQGAVLQAQHEQLERLRMLSRKDIFLRGCMAAYVMGCLSWVQQAKLRICMAPFHANPGILCVVLMEQMKVVQQQQQQSALSCAPGPAAGNNPQPAADAVLQSHHLLLQLQPQAELKQWAATATTPRSPHMPPIAATAGVRTQQQQEEAQGLPMSLGCVLQAPGAPAASLHEWLLQQAANHPTDRLACTASDAGRQPQLNGALAQLRVNNSAGGGAAAVDGAGGANELVPHPQLGVASAAAATGHTPGVPRIPNWAAPSALQPAAAARKVSGSSMDADAPSLQQQGLQDVDMAVSTQNV